MAKKLSREGWGKDASITFVSIPDTLPHSQVTWCQEEHKNMGAWSYVQPRFETAVDHRFRVNYVGRNVSPSPATGNKSKHYQELKQFLDEAMEL